MYPSFSAKQKKRVNSVLVKPGAFSFEASFFPENIKTNENYWQGGRPSKKHVAGLRKPRKEKKSKVK